MKSVKWSFCSKAEFAREGWKSCTAVLSADFRLMS